MTKVCVVGIGYVGLPLAYLLAQYTSAEVAAYDIDHQRIEAAQRGLDHTGMIPTYVVDDYHENIEWLSSMPRGYDIYIVCVPTPDNHGRPDYRYVDSACLAALSAMVEGGTLVLESTVAPGTTVDRIEPMLAQCGFEKGDVLLVYSPERINPGKNAYHELHQSIKLIGVDDPDHDAFGALALLYSRAFSGVEIVHDTRAVELAKCFENFQRDMNIAMMNELSMQCYDHRIQLSDVVRGLRTKPSSPVFHSGMVGGHCIPVDPHYLASWYDKHRAGYDLPSAGRVMNEKFIRYIYDMVRSLKAKPNVLIVGETYKPDVADTRNSGSCKLHQMFEHEGIVCDVYDPVTGHTAFPRGRKYDVLIAAVYHSEFRLMCFATSGLPLTIDCTAINVGGFTRHHFSGISNIINL